VACISKNVMDMVVNSCIQCSNQKRFKLSRSSEITLIKEVMSEIKRFQGVFFFVLFSRRLKHHSLFLKKGDDVTVISIPSSVKLGIHEFMRLLRCSKEATTAKINPNSANTTT